jgi:hypothetical protein
LGYGLSAGPDPDKSSNADKQTEDLSESWPGRLELHDNRDSGVDDVAFDICANDSRSNCLSGANAPDFRALSSDDWDVAFKAWDDVLAVDRDLINRRTLLNQVDVNRRVDCTDVDWCIRYSGVGGGN